MFLAIQRQTKINIFTEKQYITVTPTNILSQTVCNLLDILQTLKITSAVAMAQWNIADSEGRDHEFEPSLWLDEF